MFSLRVRGLFAGGIPFFGNIPPIHTLVVLPDSNMDIVAGPMGPRGMMGQVPEKFPTLYRARIGPLDVSHTTLASGRITGDMQGNTYLLYISPEGRSPGSEKVEAICNLQQKLPLPW